MEKLKNLWKKILEIHLNISPLLRILIKKLNLILYLKLKPIKWKIWFKIKILRKRKNKEYGTKLKRILFGKRINKIKCPNNKKEKRLIYNGKRNLNFPFLKSDKCKIKKRLIKPSLIGFKEENSGMGGDKLNNLVPKVEAISDLKIIRLKLSKKD